MQPAVSTRKKIKLISAVGLGISSIIGSGWLFAPYKSAAVAGPAAIYAWIFGGIIICILGLLFSEIAALYPRRGLSAIIPVISHNRYFAFPFAIANWLGIVAIIALEADATIQYLINLIPTFEPLLYHNDHLTLGGNFLSILLVVIYALINYWGASTLVKTNNIFAVIKVVIPIAISIIIIATAFHPHNFTAVKHTMIPYGVQSIFTALLTTGIIVAFNGFQTVISFSSEIYKPSRTIPLSILIAVLLSMAIYVLLQIAFIGAIPESMITAGWTQLQFSAPIVQLLGLLGLGMMSTVIYFGATASPSGAGIAFIGTSTRMFTAMSRAGQMPKYFDAVHPVYNISHRSLFINAVLAIVFLVLFPSWGSLAQVLSLFHVISYLPIPIAIWVLRDRVSIEHYSFKVPFAKAISLCLFVLFTYLFSLADMKTAVEMVILFAIFMIVFILLNSRSITDFTNIIKQSWSMIVYFASVIILVCLSPTNSHWLTTPEFLTITVITSVSLFFCLIYTRNKDFALDDSTVNLYLQSGLKTTTTTE